MDINIDDVKKQAKAELYNEQFKAAVAKEKRRLLEHKPLLARIFPWRIIIITKR